MTEAPETPAGTHAPTWLQAVDSRPQTPVSNLSYSLNALRGLARGLYRVPIIWLIKGDTMSLDYNAYSPSFHFIFHFLFRVILHYRCYQGGFYEFRL